MTMFPIPPEVPFDEIDTGYPYDVLDGGDQGLLEWAEKEEIENGDEDEL